MRAWSLYSASSDQTYAGHDGYDDAAGRHYSYDSGVPNHSQVRAGDLVLIRDGEGSIGVAFVSSIEVDEGNKIHRRCPECNTSQIEARKTVSPTYRCTNGHEFESPIDSSDAVEKFQAEFAMTYLDFSDLSPRELESLCLARSRQNAIRELDLARTLEALRSEGVFPTFTRAP